MVVFNTKILSVINGKDVSSMPSLLFHVKLSNLFVMLVEDPDKWGTFFTITSMPASMLIQFMD